MLRRHFLKLSLLAPLAGVWAVMCRRREAVPISRKPWGTFNGGSWSNSAGHYGPIVERNGLMWCEYAPDSPRPTETVSGHTYTVSPHMGETVRLS